MLAAVRAVRSLGARKVVAAIPVASVTAFRKLESVADEIVCISAPAGFVAVGQAYRNFEQTTDEEVAVLLAMQSGAKSIARDPRFCAGGTQKSEWS